MDRSQSGVNGSDAVFPVHQLTNEFLKDTFVDLFHKLELWKRFKEVSMSISIVRTATETHGSSTVMTRLP